jgi:hypothetical protein
VGVEVLGDQVSGFLRGVRCVEGKHHPRPRSNGASSASTWLALSFSYQGAGAGPGPRRRHARSHRRGRFAPRWRPQARAGPSRRELPSAAAPVALLVRALQGPALLSFDGPGCGSRQPRSRRSPVRGHRCRDRRAHGGRCVRWAPDDGSGRTT